MSIEFLPKQPSKWVSYYRVTSLLMGALLLFILESWWYGYELFHAILYKGWMPIAFWAWCFMFSFIHIFLVVMDGWSRYQNYKRIKDQFFQYGFQRRIADAYIVSRCQRQAVKVAAAELGIREQVVEYYHNRGVRWYHYVPYFMLQDPLFFFRKAFWSRTFVEKRYTPKFDYRGMALEHAL
jgi:hypothetical protein